MSQDPEKPEGPKIDWAYQIKYFVTMLVGIVAVLLLMRYLGLRG